MDIITFIVTIILVTASGALAPGPLFLATIYHGTKTGAKGGLIFSIAHTVVEFSLILLFALGLVAVANETIIIKGIGFAGGGVLIGFGIMQIKHSIVFQVKEAQENKSSLKHLFLIGLAFTGLNPYFILWWLTVGAELILISLAFASFAGVIFMYVCHVWMDYVWLIGVAYVAKKGTNVMGLKIYRIIIGLFGFVLLYFGGMFIINAISL
jgi:threonine/homoserine/homoserine lactone efflux protein